MDEEIDSSGKIVGRNPNVPGYTQKLDAVKYRAVKKLLLDHLPGKSPGWTQSEMRERLVPFAPSDLFPRGEKLDWWTKAVQLDLEARGILTREAGKPLRWHRTPTGSDPGASKKSRSSPK